MKVFVVGSGGREHALCRAIAASPKVEKIFVAPGNGGTAEYAENVDIDPGNIEALVRFARANDIGLTVPGSETVLADGIVDAFLKAGLKIFGPTKAAAELESSKAFAKELMRREGIPTAEWAVFEQYDEAVRYVLRQEGRPLVVKANGLCAGKGAIVCSDEKEALAAVDLMMKQNAFGAAGQCIVIEEKMVGEEVSLLAITDGKTIAPLASAQDHKAIFDDDKGPNTGGMGAYSPAPVLTESLLDEVIERVLVPIIHALNREGHRYKGVLYAGLMITKSGPKVVEFNCRFGDPEIQPISMRLDSDIMDLMLSAVDNTLEDVDLRWKDEAAVSVVMASGGYPGSYERGKEITGLAAANAMPGVHVFHAGTIKRGEKILSAGGRVLNVTALGKTIPEAIENAYAAVKKIQFEGAQYRTDIGQKAIKRLKK